MPEIDNTTTVQAGGKFLLRHDDSNVIRTGWASNPCARGVLKIAPTKRLGDQATCSDTGRHGCRVKMVRHCSRRWSSTMHTVPDCSLLSQHGAAVYPVGVIPTNDQL